MICEERSLNPKVLVLGATGYVGSRLVKKLLEAGYSVKASYRNERKLLRCSWFGHSSVSPVSVDVQDIESIKSAMDGVTSIFYLIHSMGQGGAFEDIDRQAALNTTSSAEEMGVEQIVYLSGLGESKSNERLSKHLRSRTEVAEILGSGSVPATTLRAAMIIGAGSASFEIMRYLVERLPVMTTPRWVRTRSQPIAISNVLNYLVGCMETPPSRNQTFDIGGPDILRYVDLMQLYSRLANLPRRLIIPIPILSPKLSSYWLNLVTPIPSSLTKPLVESLKSETICKDDQITKIITQNLLSAKEAIRMAISEIDFVLARNHPQEKPATFIPEWTQPNDPLWAGGPKYVDQRTITIRAKPEQVWKTVADIGGPTGWYYADWLWQLRGSIDEILGGAGMRRGRQDCSCVMEGHYIDCWRVLTVIPDRYLKMRAEMWLPGRSIIEFGVSHVDSDYTKLTQRITYYPSGLLGLAYWEVFYPVHLQVWQGMIERIALMSTKIYSTSATTAVP